MGKPFVCLKARPQDNLPKPNSLLTLKEDTKNLIPYKIHTAVKVEVPSPTSYTKHTALLIEWINNSKGNQNAPRKSDLVLTELANQIWPQQVIKFYEERLVWHEK